MRAEKQNRRRGKRGNNEECNVPFTHGTEEGNRGCQDPGSCSFQVSVGDQAMAVTMEMWQHCMVEMNKMNAENLAKVMKQQNDALTELVGCARGTSALTDTRVIGRPVVFEGNGGQVLGGRRS